MISTEDMIAKYIACMNEFKQRTKVIYNLLSGEYSLGYMGVSVETIALQLRKILEFIALASMVANQEGYSKARKSFRTDWNAKGIMATLEKLNKNFYPVPCKSVPTGTKDGYSTFDLIPIESPYLTKERYVRLFDHCSDLLHAYNPFSTEKLGHESFLLDDVRTALAEIKWLLSTHQVHPIDTDRMFIFVMQRRDNGEIQMTEFRAQTHGDQ